jgi:hypothetical protein
LMQSSPALQTPSLLQLAGGQTPQSCSQVLHDSSTSQIPSPQTPGSGGAAQSAGQVTEVSPPLHLPSPQNGLAASTSIGSASRRLTTERKIHDACRPVGVAVPDGARRRSPPTLDAISAVRPTWVARSFQSRPGEKKERVFVPIAVLPDLSASPLI